MCCCLTPFQVTDSKQMLSRTTVRGCSSLRGSFSFLPPPQKQQETTTFVCVHANFLEYYSDACCVSGHSSTTTRSRTAGCRVADCLSSTETSCTSRTRRTTSGGRRANSYRKARRTSWASSPAKTGAYCSE